MSSLTELRELMRRLRDPQDGCPWDLAQSYRSIVPHTLEEAYEVADTIESAQLRALPGELGDLLFQVIFYCQLGEEEGRFSFDDVVAAITEKLVTRHPHVFSDCVAEDAQAVADAWEQRKAEERRQAAATSALDHIALALPALTRAAKMQKRAAREGFDWPDASGPRTKLAEEIAEFEAAVEAGSVQAMDEELGDLLFTVVNLARHHGLEPEGSLRRATAKFERRFRLLESAVRRDGGDLQSCSAATLDAHWEQAKAAEKKTGAEAPAKDQGEVHGQF